MSLVERDRPHSYDAEQGVIASIILDGGGEPLEMCIRKGVQPDYFFNTAHQIIYESALELYNAGKSVDEISLANLLHNKGELASIGGPAYLNELTRRIEVTAHTLHWIEIVREKFYLRRIINTGTTIAEKAKRNKEGFDALRRSILVDIEDLATLGQTERGVPTVDVASNIIEDFNRWMKKEKRLVDPESMIEFGVKELDAHMWRINPHKDFWITIAGDSSHGKTTLFTHILGHNVIRRKGPGRKRAAVFLAENSRESFILQMAGQLARFSTFWVSPDKSLADWEEKHTEQHRVRLAKFEEALHAIRQAIKEGWLILFEDCETCEFVTAQCRAIVRQYGALHMVGVDYVQLLSSDKKSVQNNREREISWMVKHMRDFGKANKCPFFGISNLSKNKDKDDMLGPTRDDLKGSSDLYFHADRVWFVHRPEKNAVTGEPQSKYNPMWCVLLNQDKHRAGPTLRLHLKFIPAYGGINIYPNQPALREGGDGGASEPATTTHPHGDGKKAAKKPGKGKSGGGESSFFEDRAIPEREDDDRQRNPSYGEDEA